MKFISLNSPDTRLSIALLVLISNLPSIQGREQADNIRKDKVGLVKLQYSISELLEISYNNRQTLNESENTRQSEHGNMILNGKVGRITNSPYMGSLLYVNKNNELNYLCGATLQSQTKALTAAHCLTRQVTYYLAMGVTDLNNFRTNTFQISRVSRIDIHPDYRIFENDIAIITLSDPMTLTKHVKLIKIYKRLFPIRPNCQLNGWGLTEKGSTSVLKTAKFKIFNYKKCRNFMGVQSSDSVLVDFRREVCARSESSTVCSGDSGSPLVCNNKVVGVLAWGIEDCTLGRPGVFTRAYAHRKFINEKVNS